MSSTEFKAGEYALLQQGRNLIWVKVTRVGRKYGYFQLGCEYRFFLHSGNTQIGRLYASTDRLAEERYHEQLVQLFYRNALNICHNLSNETLIKCFEEVDIPIPVPRRDTIPGKPKR